jgi:hypothetical protein
VIKLEKKRIGGKLMYKIGMDFPYEVFVQHALETYFDIKGYIKQPIPYTDYAGVHTETGELWRIEAKGLTGNVGLDFRTGLGQLIQRMDDPNAHYGMAIPNFPSYLNQVRQIQPWVREKFQLHIWVVYKDGSVHCFAPDNPITLSDIDVS